MSAVLVACGRDDGTRPIEETAPYEIAFTSSAVGYHDGLDLYLGGDPARPAVPLVAAPNAQMYPDWAPDGRSLLFTTYSSISAGTLWVVQADGTGLRRLATGAGAAFGGRWSPDGAWIAFFGGNSLIASPIVVMRADGAARSEIVIAGLRTPFGRLSWSPAGRIAFSADTGTGPTNVWTANVDGSSPVRLTDGFRDEHPTWSPDGSRLAFASTSYVEAWPRGIVVVNADGTGRRMVTQGEMDENPAWSPDGRWLLFDRMVSGRGCLLFKVSVDGGPVTEMPTPRQGTACAGSAWRVVPATKRAGAGLPTSADVAARSLHVFPSKSATTRCREGVAVAAIRQSGRRTLRAA